MNAFGVRTHVFTLFAIDRKVNNFKNLHSHRKSLALVYGKSLNRFAWKYWQTDSMRWCLLILNVTIFICPEFVFCRWLYFSHTSNSYSKGGEKMYCIVSGISRRVFVLIMRMYVDILSAWYDSKFAFRAHFW